MRARLKSARTSLFPSSVDRKLKVAEVSTKPSLVSSTQSFLYCPTKSFLFSTQFTPVSFSGGRKLKSAEVSTKSSLFSTTESALFPSSGGRELESVELSAQVTDGIVPGVSAVYKTSVVPKVGTADVLKVGTVVGDKSEAADGLKVEVGGDMRDLVVEVPTKVLMVNFCCSGVIWSMLSVCVTSLE